MNALEAKKAIGEKLMAQLKRLKETRTFQRFGFQDISGKVLKEDLLFSGDRISAVFKLPDVLFIDHADSALIFRLRIWVNIADSLTVASQVRCEIDRRFRELGIDIAFPQRDLHIRTIPEELASGASTGYSDKKFSRFSEPF